MPCSARIYLGQLTFRKDQRILKILHSPAMVQSYILHRLNPARPPLQCVRVSCRRAQSPQRPQ